ncbi:MAG: ExeM/NucH family extracellular endonuclease [Pseudomonadota bacterium]
MKKLVATIPAPGKLTVLAALLAGLSVPAMAVSPNLVISQVYGAGGNAGAVLRNDYIEIFNRGATAVTATGWSVQYGSATSTAAWSGKSLLPTFTIEPGQYILIQEQSGGSNGALLPTPSIVPAAGFNASATTGKLALVSDNVTLSGATPTSANLVDLVGFGSANGFEGAVAPAPSATLALFRANGGCTDTDMNSTDFATGPAAPRTSDSARNACMALPKPIVLTCPASLSLEQGDGGVAVLSGTDEDSIVDGASITSAAVPGISLTGFTPAGANGGVASVNLQADPALAPGSYAVAVRFTNNAGQQQSCSVAVGVSGKATIPQIQGSGPTSPFNNAVVGTQGVVTHKVSTGYFLQDATGDGDPSTSDGLFVFSNGGAALSVGDLVRVRGTITEFRPTGAPRTTTQMKDVTALSVLSGGNSVTPTNLSFDGTLDLANVEGMLVNITNDLTVNQNFFLGSRGELTLAFGRRETATNRYAPRTAEAIALAAANARNSLVIDDGLATAPTVIPYIDGGARVVRAGDTVSGLAGVIDYDVFGGGVGFKLQFTAAPSFSATNPRTEAPVAAPGLKVASANVLNYFTTFGDGTDAFGATGQGCALGASTSSANCRGADSLAEFERQSAKVVSELLAIDADVFGLLEVQNNGDIAVNYLVQQMNGRVGFPLYAYVPGMPVTGTDAIRVAMIYKPGSVSPVGGAMSDGDTVNARPPMAQTFKAGNGGKFSVVVNHLFAKTTCGSGANADLGDGQGCSNLRRVQQATRLKDVFLPQVIAAAGDPDVLAIGDMNANGFEDPIAVLTGAGMVNQIERFVRPSGSPYSYVFNGESGNLDHALASASLDPQVAGVTEWHNNADEAAMLDYNLDGKSAEAVALYGDHAYRAADHDPVVVSLNLPATTFDVSGKFAVQRSGLATNRVTGQKSATVTLTNTSGAAVSGPFQVQFNGLNAGVTVDNATGTMGGIPYIALGNASIAAGAKVTVTVLFTNPNKVGFSYTNTVFSGTY